MKLPRRKFLRLAGGAAALPAMSRLCLGASLSDADSHVGFPYLISLGKFADLSKRESGFDSFRSGLFGQAFT